MINAPCVIPELLLERISIVMVRLVLLISTVLLALVPREFAQLATPILALFVMELLVQ